MKKIIILLSSLFLLTVAGCGGSSSNSSGDITASENEEEPFTTNEIICYKSTSSCDSFNYQLIYPKEKGDAPNLSCFVYIQKLKEDGSVSTSVGTNDYPIQPFVETPDNYVSKSSISLGLEKNKYSGKYNFKFGPSSMGLSILTPKEGTENEYFANIGVKCKDKVTEEVLFDENFKPTVIIKD